MLIRINFYLIVSSIIFFVILNAKEDENTTEEVGHFLSMNIAKELKRKGRGSNYRKCLKFKA